MSGADDLAAVLSEKGGVFPVEWCSYMWTLVRISEDRAIYSHDKNLYVLIAGRYFKSATFAVFQVV